MAITSRRLVLTAFGHALVTLGLNVWAYSAGAVQFDNPDTASSRTADVAGVAAGFLLLPGRLLWTSWASQTLPNAVEWIAFLANSLVWGFAILGALAMVSRLRNRMSRRG